jgi:hypothetical protein
VLGAAIGAIAGFIVGGLIGWLPWGLIWTYMRLKLKWSSTENLRARVEQEQFISHLLIAELLCRGKRRERFRAIVIRQLASSDALMREFGKANVRFWFPDLLERKRQAL